MNKNTFFSNKSKNLMHYANVGGHNARFLYIEGYYKAAKELSEIAINADNSYLKDIYFYPICYNYRHYTELHIKSLIHIAEELYNKMEVLGFLENGFLETKLDDNSLKTHSLEKLYVYLTKRLTLVSNERFPDETRKYIMQLHNIDSNGERFRYHIKTKNNDLSFLKTEQYDLKNILEIMQKISNTLYAIEGFLFHYIDISNYMIEEMEEECYCNLR